MQGHVSAIIPTFNRAHMLRECINSVLAQTRPVQEIIVVDDGSTDDTKSVVSSYGDRVRLLSKANGGKSSALNLGLAHCTADYVWICDDDDYAAPDALEHLAPALDADPSIGFAYGRFRTFKDEDGERSFQEPAYWARPEEPDAFINFLEGMFSFQFAMLVRRSAYHDVGDFRPDLIRSQDYDMTLRLARVFKTSYVPEVIFYQRQHAGQRGAAGNRFAADRSELRWLEYDHRIFDDLRKKVPLERFTPTFAKVWPFGCARRAALLQRACVFAKRGMWRDAADDLEEAAQQSANAATIGELALAEGVLTTFPAWNILLEDRDAIRRLRILHKKSPYGRAILFAICRPLVWQTKHYVKAKQAGKALGRFQLLIAVLGIEGAYARILASLRRSSDLHKDDASSPFDGNILDVGRVVAR